MSAESGDDTMDAATQAELDAWLAETASPERDQWLVNARQMWQSRLTHMSEQAWIEITQDCLPLFALDLPLLDAFRDALIERSVTNGVIQLCETSSIHDVRLWNDRSLPDAVGNHIALAIGRALAAGPSVNTMTCEESALVRLMPILSSCVKIARLAISFSRGVPIAHHQPWDFSQHQALASVLLLNTSNDNLRTMCPGLSVVPQLTSLTIYGRELDDDSCLLLTEADTDLLCTVLQKTSIRRVSLDCMEFASEATAKGFLNSLHTLPLEQLELGRRFEIPGSMHSEYATSLASARVKYLDFYVPNDDAFSLFATALTKSPSFELECIRIRNQHDDHKSFGYRIGMEQPLNHGFDPTSTQAITRALDIHRERRTSLPVFERFQEQQARVDSARLRFAEPFAARPAIVFEYLRHDKWKLLTRIRECSELALGSSADGSRPTKRRKLEGTFLEGTSAVESSQK